MLRQGYLTLWHKAVCCDEYRTLLPASLSYDAAPLTQCCAVHSGEAAL
jgi:hypothetical protein